MKKILTMMIAGLLLLCSCEKEIKFRGDYSEPKLVLFSTACVGQPLSVQLRRSRFILENYPSDFYDDAVTGAEVIAEVNGKSVSFTGDSLGYYHSDYVPSVGDRITIRAGKDGFEPVSSSAVVPDQAKFGLEKLEIVEEHSEVTLRQWKVTMKFYIDDPAQLRNFYRLKAFFFDGEFEQEAFMMSKDIVFYNSMNGGEIDLIEDFIDGDEIEFYVPETIDDAMIDGRKYTFEVWFNISKWAREYWYSEELDEYIAEEIEDLLPSDIKIEVDALSEDLYKYCRSLEDYEYSDSGLGNFFNEAVCIHNNISGGIGCFGAVTPKMIVGK